MVEVAAGGEYTVSLRESPIFAATDISGYALYLYLLYHWFLATPRPTDRPTDESAETSMVESTNNLRAPLFDPEATIRSDDALRGR